MITLPSCSLRSKYLKTLPVHQIFNDPKTGHKYQVQEKRVGNSLVKVAVNYLGNEDGIILEDIPESMFKLQNPTRANITQLMKSKINSLEDTCRKLIQNQHRPLYHRIKEILNENFHETDETYYLLHSGLVLPFKKKHYSSIDVARANVDHVVHKIFKEPKVLAKMMEKQHNIQTDLMRMLMNNANEGTDDDEVREVLV